MNAEVDLFGVYLPGLLLLAILAVIVTGLLTRVLLFVSAYRYFAYRPLVDVALFVLVLGALDLLLGPSGA